MKLVIDHLEKHFEKKEVLRDLSFTFESGRIYGLLGRNGAGKTTFFNCLNRDLKADGGRFFLEDERIEKTNLDSREFKEKIIAALREEGHE